MSGWLALVCEGLAVVLVGVAPTGAVLRRGGAALLLLALPLASLATSTLLCAPIHLLTLGLAATFLVLVPRSGADDDQDASGRWDSALVASLLVASSSRGWHVFLSACAIASALWVRFAGLRGPLSWFGAVLGAAGLFYSALGSFAFPAAPLGGGASAALLTGSLALTVAAALLAAGAAFRCATDTTEPGGQGRRLVLFTWSAVLMGSGPLASAFSDFAWRDATGGWQGLLAVSGVVGVGAAVLSASRGLGEGGAPARLAGPLLALQLALAWVSWGGAGAAARLAVELGVAASLVAYLLFQTAGGAIWVRRIAFLALGGVPASPAFWAHAFGLASLARAESYGLFAVVALGSVFSWVLVAHAFVVPGAPFGVEKKSRAWSPRLVVLGLLLLSLFPGWLTARAVGDF